MPLLKGDLINLSTATFDEQASNVATPPDGKWRPFFKSDGLYLINDQGTVYGPVQTSAPVQKYAKIVETWSQGTDGGAFAGGGVTRTLNSIVIDADGIIIGSLGAQSQFTLAAGRYRFSAGSVMVGVGAHQVVIAVTSDASGVIDGGYGATVYSGAGVGAASVVGTEITIAAQTDFGVFDYAETANEDLDALGHALDVADAPEIYAWIEIWKVG